MAIPTAHIHSIRNLARAALGQPHVQNPLQPTGTGLVPGVVLAQQEYETHLVAIVADDGSYSQSFERVSTHPPGRVLEANTPCWLVFNDEQPTILTTAAAAQDDSCCPGSIILFAGVIDDA